MKALVTLRPSAPACRRPRLLLLHGTSTAMVTTTIAEKERMMIPSTHEVQAFLSIQLPLPPIKRWLYHLKISCL